MFKLLKKQLEPFKDTNNKETYQEYQGSKSFGYLIHDKCEYFYVFKNEFNRNLFNNMIILNKVNMIKILIFRIILDIQMQL